MYAGLSNAHLFAALLAGKVVEGLEKTGEERPELDPGVGEDREEKSGLDPGSGEDGEETSEAGGYETVEEEEERPSQQSLVAAQQEVGEEEMPSKQSVAADQQQISGVKGGRKKRAAKGSLGGRDGSLGRAREKTLEILIARMLGGGT